MSEDQAGHCLPLEYAIERTLLRHLLPFCVFTRADCVATWAFVSDFKSVMREEEGYLGESSAEKKKKEKKKRGGGSFTQTVIERQVAERTS